MTFDKIKNFLSRNKSWITVLTLIIIQISLIDVIEKYGDSLQANPIKIKCDDPALLYPKAFDYRAHYVNILLLVLGIILLFGASLFLTFMEMSLTSELTGLTFPGSDSVEIAPLILLIRWVSVAVIGYLFVLLITFTSNYYVGTVAPNFLSACIPKPQKFLCNNGFVCVTCTALPHIWRRAAYSFPPTYVTLHGYVMFAAVYFIEHRFFWRGPYLYVNSFAQMTCIAWALQNGYYTVYYNDANWGEVLIGYLIGAGTAWMIIRLTFVWMKWGKEPELPYYWNDVLGKIIVSRTGEIPFPAPPRWDREPGQMEQQLQGQQNNQNESPQPGQETSQPSSYQPIVFPAGYFTSGNTGSPPSYEDSIALNRT